MLEDQTFLKVAATLLFGKSLYRQLVLQYVCACAVASVLSLYFVTQWRGTHQAPLFMGFSRQEYWSGLPCLPPGDLPDPGTKPTSPALKAES